MNQIGKKLKLQYPECLHISYTYCIKLSLKYIITGSTRIFYMMLFWYNY